MNSEDQIFQEALKLLQSLTSEQIKLAIEAMEYVRDACENSPFLFRLGISL